MSQRLFLPREQVLSNLGVIGAGFKLWFYETSTDDLKNTYSDIDLTIPNTNPVIADSAGRIGDIYVNDTSLYKVILQDANDNQIWEADPADPFQITYAILDPLPIAFAGTTGGTGLAYTLTSDLGLTEYSSTQAYLIEFHALSQAGATLQFLDSDTLTVLPILKYDLTGNLVPIEDNDIVGTQFIWNDGENFVVLDPYKPYLSPENITPATTTQVGVSYLPSLITIANNVSDPNNDIDFSAGNYTLPDGSARIIATALTKKLDVNWAAGTNQGGLDTGVKANTTWYYCYAIYNPTDKISDFIFSASNVSPTLPTGYTQYKKLLGGIRTDGSGNILPFLQAFNTFIFITPLFIFNGSGSISNVTVNNIFPDGVTVEGKITMQIDTGSAGANGLQVFGNQQIITNLFQPSGVIASGNNTGSGQSASATGLIYCDDGAVTHINNISSPGATNYLYALGFVDLSSPF
ncbi:MAG: hypothetical protein ULS35scaffold63_31 [Phage 33_17]|nr:MAG: hypothetical protein ULS35scaffold63_31 [Phage 33_17]